MGASQLHDLFRRSRDQARTVFMPFMTAGVPDMAQSPGVFQQLAAAGADAFEVGIPYSDPLMDGPVIQAASSQALAGGMTFRGGLDLAREVAESTGLAVIVMTYVNPILQLGPEQFAVEAKKSQVAGVIVADVPFEESMLIKVALDDAGIGMAMFAAPTTTEKRLRGIAAAEPTFIYAVADLGVTGIRDQLQSDLQGLVRRIRGVTSIPIVLGVGISTPDQAREAARLADGVIVGSALVSEVMETGGVLSASAFAEAVHAL